MHVTQLLLWIGIALTASSSVELREISGRLLRPFMPEGKANILFFITSDCPISNSYAPEIQRICRDYEAKGVRCSLLYEDLSMDPAAARKHLQEYGYRDIAAAIDAERKVAAEAKAIVTPQAVVVDAKGEIRYSGRINNFYAALGKSRLQVTANDLRDAVDAVLSGKPVANPETQAVGCYIVPADPLSK